MLYPLFNYYSASCHAKKKKEKLDESEIGISIFYLKFASGGFLTSLEVDNYFKTYPLLEKLSETTY